MPAKENGIPAPEKENGTIAIVDGLVKISDPVGDGLFALIGPDPLAEIKVNGKIVEEKHAVSSADKVEIVPRQEETPPVLNVEISPDRMKAFAIITPRIVIKRRLKDRPPSPELVLDFAEERRAFLEISAEDVYRALKEKGVVFGLDQQAIEKAVKEASGQPEVVARGREVVPGRDGFVELLFDPQIRVSSYDEESLEKVNFKERIIIPSVNEGDVLAVIHPPSPGTPGCTVTGQLIEPPPVREAAVKCKDGCTLSARGDRVLATRAGRPLAEGKNNETLRVLNVHVHHGDVDVKSGNIRFGGELKITGDILEGMVVESLGNLQVMGHTAGAQVISGGSIVFQGNVINSRVQAGLMKGFYQKMHPCLSEIAGILEDLKESLYQLAETMAARGKKIGDRQAGYLLKLLVERKFPSMPQLCEDILKILKEAKFSPPSFLADTLKEAGAVLRDLAFIQSWEQFAEVVAKIKSATAYVEGSQNIQGDIIAFYVQNSFLECSGNIMIRGAGSYNTFFQAGGDIHIEGVFRGGEIKAQGNIFIGEAGSPGLILKQGTIYLAPDSTAKFRKVYENVRIFFGRRSFKFEETRTMVKVFYVPQEDLIRVINL